MIVAIVSSGGDKEIADEHDLRVSRQEGPAAAGFHAPLPLRLHRVRRSMYARCGDRHCDRRSEHAGAQHRYAFACLNQKEASASVSASGAFGKIISEYVIGNIDALYRELPNYWKNKQKHLWVQNRSSEAIYGKNILILGTGDIGRNIAHRMKAFETHVTSRDPVLHGGGHLAVEAVDQGVGHADQALGLVLVEARGPDDLLELARLGVGQVFRRGVPGEEVGG